MWCGGKAGRNSTQRPKKEDVAHFLRWPLNCLEWLPVIHLSCFFCSKCNLPFSVPDIYWTPVVWGCCSFFPSFPAETQHIQPQGHWLYTNSERLTTITDTKMVPQCASSFTTPTAEDQATHRPRLLLGSDVSQCVWCENTGGFWKLLLKSYEFQGNLKTMKTPVSGYKGRKFKM